MVRRRAHLLSIAIAAGLVLWAALAACSADDSVSSEGTTAGTSGPGTTRPSGGAMMTTTPAGQLVTGDSLNGATFTSTSVTGRELAPGTQITLEFTRSDVSASAGCNSTSGTYSLDGTTLTIDGHTRSTVLACPPPIDEQEAWFDQWLTTPLAIAATPTGIELRGDGVTVQLERQVTPPAAGSSPDELVGPTWTVHDVEVGDAVTSVAPASAPSFRFLGDGTVEVFTGCNTGTTTYEASGDGRISFGGPIATPQACADPSAEVIEVAIVTQLGSPGAMWRFDDADLRLSNAEGALIASPT